MRALALSSIMVAVIAGCVAGCGNKDSKSSGGSASASADNANPPPRPRHPPGPAGQPHPQDKLTVTLADRPVAMVTALAFKRASGEVEIVASSLPVSCSQVTSTMREIYANEITFDVTFASQLQPDGTIRPGITSEYYDGTTSTVTIPAVGSGDGADGATTTLDVDFDVSGTKNDKLAVKGTLEALGCPAQERPPQLPLPPEMPATITIAGKKLAVRGAMLENVPKRPTLILTTGGETCAHAAGEVEGQLFVALHWWDAAKPDVGQIDLAGAMLPRTSDQTYDKKKIKIDPAPPTLAQPIKLHADIVVNKYPVQLDGTVTPVICP
jgi:hypothetical protein